MSNRYGDYNKGSSRSTRDDSRTPREPRESSWSGRERKYNRSRSRSPRRQETPPAPSISPVRLANPSSSRDKQKYEEKKNPRLSPNEWEDSDEEVPAPPPPPRITKISIGFSKPEKPIKMTLGGSKLSASIAKPTVASVFTEDDEDEPEEMPAEAKMRMRNIGRETPTSAGPNSFGKTKQGFCDAKKVFEKNLKEALETNPGEKSMTKFPQTIYKIKGP